MTSEKKPQQVQVDLPADLEPVYSNLAMISHSASEFFVDLAYMLPNLPKARVHTRVVMTPTHAKLLQRALTENLKRYEAQFGQITTPTGGINPSFPGGEQKPQNGST